MAKNLLKKTASVIITVLLIISTSLCIFLIAKSAFKGSVSIAGYRLFYVVTGSMEPTIHSGAVVLTKESDSYVIGDIITFKSQNSEILGQPNTHRIVDINDDGSFVTKGDAILYPYYKISIKYNGDYYVALNYDYDLEKYPAIALTGRTRGDLLVNLDDNEMVIRCSLE